jgi:hypothetical protein
LIGTDKSLLEGNTDLLVTANTSLFKKDTKLIRSDIRHTANAGSTAIG